MCVYNVIEAAVGEIGASEEEGEPMDVTPPIAEQHPKPQEEGKSVEQEKEKVREITSWLEKGRWGRA